MTHNSIFSCLSVTVLLELTTSCNNLLSVTHLICKIWFAVLILKIIIGDILSCMLLQWLPSCNVIVSYVWQPDSIFGTAKPKACTFYQSSLKMQASQEPLCFKFANDASLKKIKAAFDMWLIFGYDKTPSLDFNSLVNWIAVIRSLTGVSLI